ncbi:MAG: hypothetical protein QG671_1701, partial [Actinomycetota bacterium]|nr:hypothetical protein [Actinomycetota bacterium]
MNGLTRVGGVVIVHGTAARTLCEAVLIAERARRSSGLPCSGVYGELARELHAAAAAAGHSDVRAEASGDSVVVSPTVPIEQAAAELGVSKRQARRLAPDLGGKLVGGRWL